MPMKETSLPSAILKGNADLVFALGTQCSHKSLIFIDVVAGLMAQSNGFKRCFGATVLGLKKSLDLFIKINPLR